MFIPSHENPLHDGAVIIREGRIWQAGAFLPLTASTKLDRNLGTRHRAAIGISEETDAVVIVVSEERGEVSLCFNGNIVRNLDAALLRKVLLGLFQKRQKRKPGTGGRDERGGKDRASRISQNPPAPGEPSKPESNTEAS
jgi:diadenylate cyclase